MNKQQKQQLEVLREYRKEVIENRKAFWWNIIGYTMFIILSIIVISLLTYLIILIFHVGIYHPIYDKGYDAGIVKGKIDSFNQIFENLKDYDCEGNITFRNNQSEEIKLKKLDCPKLIVMNTTDSVFRIGSRGILK